jgi:hypothetical protein
MRTITIISPNGKTVDIQARGAARAALSAWNGINRPTQFFRVDGELWVKRPGIRLSPVDALTDPAREAQGSRRFRVLDGESAGEALARFHTIAATEDWAVFQLDEFGEDWRS